MDDSELVRFLSDVRNDAALQEEIGRLKGDSEAFLHLVGGLGYRLTAKEREHLAASFAEISDEEIELVAGGAWSAPSSPAKTSACC
jgi:predicted ribosomally synthesized peptide with nif11-like leader